ncbi:hypothetical protein U9M48_023986 [Paspalum notatum var. saurae]|uniref:Uncharacterized protein n=1 Tax=Paspalum notatum var. saurae TaxID=547442 RepID=A0AAQ3TM15_PASNO
MVAPDDEVRHMRPAGTPMRIMPHLLGGRGRSVSSFWIWQDNIFQGRNDFHSVLNTTAGDGNNNLKTK